MNQTDTERRTQRRALQRALDAVEDTALSPEEVQRKIAATGFNAAMPIDELLSALCQRIGRWRPPGAQATREEARAAYHSYARLSRLADALGSVLAGIDAAFTQAAAANAQSRQEETTAAEPAQAADRKKAAGPAL